MSEWPYRFFRPAPNRSIWVNAGYSILQTIAMWGVFLAAIPALVIHLQAQLGITRFDPENWATISVLAFWASGSLGLYCGWLFVRFGHGTPLPLDQTTHLVVLGPYRIVRNPMALLGILQGVCVGVWLGSWPVIAYALSGAIVWHFTARPFEERDLERRHGEEYTRYKDSVHNWIPNLKPYPKVVGTENTTQPDSDTESSSAPRRD